LYKVIFFFLDGNVYLVQPADTLWPESELLKLFDDPLGSAEHLSALLELDNNVAERLLSLTRATATLDIQTLQVFALGRVGLG